MRYVNWGNGSPSLRPIGDLAQLIPVSCNAGAEIEREWKWQMGAFFLFSFAWQLCGETFKQSLVSF